MFLTKYSNRISGVRKIELYERYLIVLFVNKNIAVYDLLGEDCFLEQGFNTSSIYLIKNKVYSARDFLLDLGKMKICHLKELEGVFFSGINNEDLLLFNTFDSHKVCALDDGVSIKHTYPISENKSIVYLNLEGTLWLSENRIEYLKYDNGLLWRKEFVDLLGTSQPQLNGAIQFKENLLFFVLNDRHESKSAFFVLNALSGQVLFVEHSLGGFIKYFDNALYRLYEKQIATFNIKNFEWNYQNMHDVLVELDRSKEEFTSTGESVGQRMQDFKFSTSCYDVNKNELLFSQDRGSQVGLLDLASKLLLWNMDFKQKHESALIKNVRLLDSYLYVIDDNNTLYIFEREKSNA